MPAVAHAGAVRPILIVDDNADIREALAMLLEARGHMTVTADNGATALHLLRNDHVNPCVILLDYSMPVMDGTAFRRAQQSDPELADLPVVLYSGVADLSREAAGLNVSHVLQKPLNLDRLVELVDRYC